MEWLYSVFLAIGLAISGFFTSAPVIFEGAMSTPPVVINETPTAPKIVRPEQVNIVNYAKNPNVIIPTGPSGTLQVLPPQVRAPESAPANLPLPPPIVLPCQQDLEFTSLSYGTFRTEYTHYLDENGNRLYYDAVGITVKGTATCSEDILIDYYSTIDPEGGKNVPVEGHFQFAKWIGAFAVKDVGPISFFVTLHNKDYTAQKQRTLIYYSKGLYLGTN